jgi:hypothetical protein
MTPWITRVAVVSAAGWGVEALMDALCAEPSLRASFPAMAPGLRSPFAALAHAAVFQGPVPLEILR